jgi:hypothetical protein
MEGVLLISSIALGLALYFLPAIVAGSREHHHIAPIFVLNLLLGWTLVGWVVSLVWAVMPVQARSAAPVPVEAEPDTTPDPTPTPDQVDRIVARWGTSYR